MTAAEPPRRNWLWRWVERNIPRRDTIASNRWLRPFARRMTAPGLWRLTRRSVPRGVALGVVTGILVPMGQIPASALLAMPLRANIPAAAATTLITNPVTTPPLWVAAYWLGSWVLGLPIGLPSAAKGQGWGEWLFQQAGPATLFGLVAITFALTILLYVGTALAWRWWIARKWRQRRRKRAKLA